MSPIDELQRMFASSNEENTFVKKYKISLSKRLSLSRTKELFEAVDLAFYLVALDRQPEALSLVSFLSNNIEFPENYNIWSPVGYAICLQIRLHRMANDLVAASQCLNLIRLHPVYVVDVSQSQQLLERFRSQLELIYAQRSSKWSCQSLSRALYKLCCIREVYVVAIWNLEPDLVNETEALVVNGFHKLRSRLELA